MPLRAQRLDLPTDQLRVMAETCVERICEVWLKSVLLLPFLTQFKPYIQKLCNLLQVEFHKSVNLLPYLLVLLKIAEQHLFIVGHVTKEGALAGPRVLEHMVDCVLYLKVSRILDIV